MYYPPGLTTCIIKPWNKNIFISCTKQDVVLQLASTYLQLLELLVQSWKKRLCVFTDCVWIEPSTNIHTEETPSAAQSQPPFSHRSQPQMTGLHWNLSIRHPAHPAGSPGTSPASPSPAEEEGLWGSSSSLCITLSKHWTDSSPKTPHVQ